MLERLRRAVRSWKYLFAIITMVAACGLYLLLQDFLPGVVFITFFPAIFAVALLCGWQAGLLSLLLGLALAWFVIIPPAFSFTTGMEELPRLAAFSISGGLLVWLAALMERKERLYRAEAERSALLFRELKHRVANVLQLCSSLLRVRARDLNPQDRHVLTEAAAQLVAMQRIHDRIAGAGERVDLEPVLRDLCDTVVQLAPGMTYDLHCGGVALPRDHLIPVGLIVQELLSNAVEHGGSGGSVAVAIEATPRADGWRLSVTDNGRGLPNGFSIDGGTRQGLKIVRALAAQAEATFSLVNRSDGSGVRAELASSRQGTA